MYLKVFGVVPKLQAQNFFFKEVSFLVHHHLTYWNGNAMSGGKREDTRRSKLNFCHTEWKDIFFLFNKVGWYQIQVIRSGIKFDSTWILLQMLDSVTNSGSFRLIQVLLDTFWLLLNWNIFSYVWKCQGLVTLNVGNNFFFLKKD